MDRPQAARTVTASIERSSRNGQRLDQSEPGGARQAVMTITLDNPEAPVPCNVGHATPARFRFARKGAVQQKCLRHAVAHRPLVRTATVTALVVGTILTTINQGNLLYAGTFPAALAWKIPLTYCVPYCVATWSALRISRIG